MDSKSCRNVNRSLKEPTVSSVLGIKGQLRFRPHGSTQKAHVVLRQVDWSPEDSEDEADPSMIYFSLFAQKRIEVKPGKEILLAVATPDGNFMDTPVILAGKLTGEDADMNRDIMNQGGSASSTLRHCTVPPKMRKTWSKLRIDQTQSSSAVSHIYTSVGVQADLSNPPPQKIEFTTPSPDTRAAPCLRERSLSPMELSSAPSSPAAASFMELASEPSSPSPPSPAPVPTVTQPLEGSIKSPSFSPPGLWVSPSPQLQPVVIRTDVPPVDLSVERDNPPGLSLAPLPEKSRPATPVRPIPVTAEQAEKDAIQWLSNMHTLSTTSSTGTVTASPRIPAPSSAPIDGEKAGTTSSSVVSSAPYVPKRKIVPNPFVSGGLLTDFVSSSAAKKAVNTPQGELSHLSAAATQTETPRLSQLPAKVVSSSDEPGVTSHYENNRTVNASAIDTPTTVVRKAPSPAPSASPSSSKVKVEDILPQQGAPPSHHNSMAYDPTRPDLQLPLHPPRFPPMAMPNFPPNLARPALPLPLPLPPPPPPPSLWSNVHLPPPSTKRPTPPPDHSSLAFVPTSSYSNPLGIKPATPGGTWQHDKYVPSINAPPDASTPSITKKPVPIGNGWPHNRKANGHTPKASQRPSLKVTGFNDLTPSPSSVSPVQQLSAMNSVSVTGVTNTLPILPLTANSIPQGDELTTKPYSPALPAMNRSGMIMTPLYVNGSGQPTASPASPTFVPAASNTIRPPGEHNSSLSHPLPLKPSTFTGPGDGWSPAMGVKRMGSPSLQSQSPDSRRHRSYNWPTSEATYSLCLESDSDAGIRTICHNSDGSLCAVTCFDKSVRILSTKTRTELAKLAHNMQVTAVAWMDRDVGIITLGENGIVSTWTRSAGNKWQWAKILDSSAGRSDEEPGCLAFGRDRIAISYPRTGVKVWLFIKGTWLPQRSILRQNVTAIKFVEEGEALIGGTTDGVLWYCQVPNGTLRAYSFMKSKVYALDVDPRGSHAVAAQTGGKSHLVNIAQDDQKGKVEQVYTINESDPDAEAACSDFGAFFASRGQRLLFGVARGCIMVWDRTSGEVVHGLNHSEGQIIQAVACFDGSQAAEGHILTGTRQGHLTWFAQPPTS